MDAKKLFIFSLAVMAMTMAVASASNSGDGVDAEGGPYIYCMPLCTSTFKDAECDAKCLGENMGHGKCIFTGSAATQKTCCCHG